jgi:hypothetical protein
VGARYVRPFAIAGFVLAIRRVALRVAVERIVQKSDLIPSLAKRGRVREGATFGSPVNRHSIRRGLLPPAACLTPQVFVRTPARRTPYVFVSYSASHLGPGSLNECASPISAGSGVRMMYVGTAERNSA